MTAYGAEGAKVGIPGLFDLEMEKVEPGERYELPSKNVGEGCRTRLADR